MPVKKASKVKPMPKEEPMVVCDCSHCSWGWDFAKKILVTLLGVLLVYLVFYFGTLVRNNLKTYDNIGYADRSERMITVMGYGEINGSNDIAMTTLGYSNINKDVAKAQADNEKVMSAVMQDLVALGVSEKDLQSDYSIYPEYEYDETGRQFSGYRVSSRVTVKIRNLDNIEKVLVLAGKHGANEVGGLSFTIDDPENLKDQARVEALLNAQLKAIDIANMLGVRLVGVVGYSEYDSSPYYPVYKNASSIGMGGDMMMEGAVPEMSSGSQDVGINVNVTFEIMP